MIRSETLRTTYCGLDPSPLQHRATVDGPFNVHAKHVPVQFVQAERCILGNLNCKYDLLKITFQAIFR